MEDEIAGQPTPMDSGGLGAADPAAAQDIGLRLSELLDLGGPVVLILIVMSVFALAIILLKIWQFSRLGAGNTRSADRALGLYADGRADEAHALVTKGRSPVALVVGRALDRLRHGAAAETARADATALGADILEDMRSFLRVLEVIATLSPLLGLFGTVLGMIDAFRALEMAGNNVDPSTLSGGIWVALLTTAVGIGVAMPVVAMLNWFERRIERVAHGMDSALNRLFVSALPDANEESRHDGHGRIAAAAAGE